MTWTVENWGNGYGWIIADPDADLDDGEGGINPMNRVCVAGFKSKAAALRWLRINELAKACGVGYGFRSGIGYD